MPTTTDLYPSLQTAEPEPPTATTKSPPLQRLLVGGLLALGVVLRLIQYLSDRPLWYDEAMLANNIISRSFAALVGNLDEGQIAPLGFLWLEKSATVVFGTSESALRLIPLLMSLAALVLFWMVAVRALPRFAALLALTMFAVSPRLIYYAAEVKQYSADAAVGIGLILLALEVVYRDFDRRWIGWLAAAGVLGVWLSQPAVFIVAAVIVALALELAHRRDVAALGRIAGVGVACALSFGASFAVARSAIGGSEIMPTFWAAGFLPLPPTTSTELMVWLEAFVRPFRDPLMFTLSLGAVLLYLLGLVALASGRKPMLLVLLAAPVLLTMIAAGLHLYPYGDDIFYGGRVLLFLAPMLLLPIAAGAELVRRTLAIRPVVFGLIAGMLMVAPRMMSEPIATLQQRIPALRSQLLAPPLPPMATEWQDPRPVLRRMAEHTRPDDLIYVYTIAGPPFRYYAPRFGVAGSWVRGEASGGDPAAAADEIEMLRGQARAWLFFAYAHGGRAVPFIEHANRIGEPILVLEEAGVGALLYDLSGK